VYTIVGDPHVTHKSLDKAALLFDILEDIGNPVVILGDLFDTKEIVRGKCLNFVLKRLSESKLHFYILVGNHDWFNLDCKEHSLEALKTLKNVSIVDKPFRMNMDSRAVLMLPYYDNMEALKAELAEAKEGGTDFVFMHQGVVGFDYGNGYIADGNGHGEIKPDFLQGFTRIISGHFHKYAEDGNLMFLGTPFSHTFGESDQKKYIGILSPHENELELLETPFPKHRTVEVDCSKPDALKKLKKQMNDKDLFRVKLIGTGIEIKSIDQSQFPGVKFIEEQTDGDQVETASISDTDSNEQKFLNWAKEIKGLDDNTIQLGLEIMGEAV
jgi:DNA repair exonuclease SbcCD nuclease subunit